LTAPPYVATDTIRALYDLGEGRIAAMDAARVDKQVLSLWSPGVQVFDPMLGTELARLANDRVAAAVRQHPDRFAALAAIAPQAPAAAAQEIERAVSQLGLHGVIINSHTNSEFLDNAKYWPIFEAAQALNTPIYIHPRNAPVQMYDAFTDYTMGGALWGFAMETSTHVVRLLMSGVFDEFPEDRARTSWGGPPVLVGPARSGVGATGYADAATQTQRILPEQLLDHHERHVLGSGAGLLPFGVGGRQDPVRHRLAVRALRGGHRLVGRRAALRWGQAEDLSRERRGDLFVVVVFSGAVFPQAVRKSASAR
jgi:hypothetical protein